jgi:N-acetyl-1-D-myo-inositol-2-amino-2-deoxy-alpha-D-glucopyranoside deacetylase
MNRTPGAVRRDQILDVRAGDRWLVAVAHPDDETFGCGSTIARAAGLGARVVVVCATRGEAGEPRPDVSADGGLGAMREQELHRAAARLGVADVELLGYRDSGFDGPPAAGTLCAAPLHDVTEVFARVVDRRRPDVVVVLDGSDGHRDHLRVREAVHAALSELSEPRPVLAEQCLPNSLMRRWLAEMRLLRPGTVYHSLDPTTLGRDDADITHVLDASAVLEQREAAIAEHSSQASPFDGLSEDLRRAFLSSDHLAVVDLCA